MDCRFWYSIPESNERYIVIEVHRWRTGTAAGSLATVSRSGRLLRLAPVIPGRRILTAAGLPTAKHLHGATNIDHHLCGVFILAGQDKYTTEVVVNIGGTMQMLGGRQSGSGQNTSSRNDWGQPQQPSGPTHSGQATGSSAGAPPMDFDDDIPFIGFGYGVPKSAIHAL